MAEDKLPKGRDTCTPLPFQNKKTNQNKSLTPHRLLWGWNQIIKIDLPRAMRYFARLTSFSPHTARKWGPWSLPICRWGQKAQKCSVTCPESLGHCIVLYPALKLKVNTGGKEYNSGPWPRASASALWASVSPSCKMREMFGWWVRIFEVPVLWGALNISVKIGLLKLFESPMTSIVHSVGINVHFCLF